MFGDDDSEQSIDFECSKCGCKEAESTEIATAGSKMQKMLDLQSQKFDVVYCVDCGYSEFYNKETSRLEDVVDFALGD